MEKPTLPKGTRDFGPDQMAKRQYIFTIIRKVFEKYGFQPLETPAMENLSTLSGKYGEEGDQLLFRVLNSGDFLSGVDKNELGSTDARGLSPKIAEKGLKYDLTVPFARYVVMNRHDITFPFRRYQIQPVWRADRPQKGRYREFYQCDADVVGTDSLLCEAEIILLIKEIFSRLSLHDYTIKINHRAILSGMFESLKIEGRDTELFMAIDKLDKSGNDKVKEELIAKGFASETIESLFEFLNPERSIEKKLQDLATFLLDTKQGPKGIEDITVVLNMLEACGSNANNVVLDVSLARGLSYYTGCIFEVKVNSISMGSVCGGGRYDNLTAVFDAKERSSGVGISFGVDRIYDAMEELNLFPEDMLGATSKVLLCHVDQECFQYALKTVYTLRDRGVASEVYPDSVKLKKQLEYADRKKIPFVIVIGDNEMRSGMLTVKNMRNGEQQELSIVEVIQMLSVGLNPYG